MDASQYSIFFPDGGGGITAGVGAGAGGGAGAPKAAKKDLKATDDDIGYAFPIEISFQAASKDGWGFIYSVLNLSPLYQLYRIQVAAPQGAAARPENANLYNFKAEFLFVSKLKTINDVQQKLQQLVPAGTPAPAVAAAPAPAAAAAAKK